MSYELIKLDNINPYVATVGPISTKIDYDLLKKSKVSAMMFNAGSLYDQSHLKKTYKNPYLAGQVKGCQAAGLPFALYADVRAHNEIEADAECRSLYYILADHPPQLGIWLYLNTNQNVETNNKILDVYYKYIEKWGFKAKCGIYIEISRLSEITWINYQSKYYLWGIDRNIDLSTVQDKLLTPEMFEVAD